MFKEKSKNKIKAKHNKYPLPKIKPNTNISIKPKLVINKHISEVKNHNDLEFIKINIQKEKKDILPKTNFRFKNINSAKNSSANRTKAKFRITLKLVLKEYGLSEYLKKMNEIGYNNDNFYQIGNLTRKNYLNFLNQISIYPLHYEKMEKFYEFLKRYNHNKQHQNNIENNSNNNKNNNFSYNHKNIINDNNKNNINTPQYEKRQFNFNSNNNLLYNNNNENNKTNQIYNMNNFNQNNINNNKINYNIYNGYEKYNPYKVLYHRKSLNIKRKKYKKKYTKSKSRPKTSNPKIYSRGLKIRIRNNYSGKKMMKRKLQNFSLIHSPYLSNSIDDNSSLIKSYFNDYQSMAENHKMNLMHLNIKNINKIKIFNNNNNYKNNSEMNTLKQSQNNNNINDRVNYYSNDSEYNDKLNENIERMLNQYMIQLNEKLDKSYDSIEDSSLSHIITSQMGETNEKNNDKKDNILPKYKILITTKEENNDSNKNKKDVIDDNNDQLANTDRVRPKDIINKDNNNNKEIFNKSKEDKNNILPLKKVESSKDIKHLSEPEISTKSKDSKEQPVEDIESEYLKKNNLREKDLKCITKEEAAQLLLEENNKLNDKKYNYEQNLYETLRLNKSFDEENRNKETIKFDIEFICRCFGLALMKLIEQSQEKEHITELYDDNEQNNKLIFPFFNDEYNNNISLLEDFFKIDKNNNNEKLLGNMNILSVLEQLDRNKNEINNDDISLVKHIKKENDENYIIKEEDNIQEETFKLKNDLLDMDKELKFLGHYFSYRRGKTKDYQGLSENTKKILGKDLSYIKEIDSEINRTGSKVANNSESNLSKSNNNNSNIIRNENNSENDINNDSKNNNENKNKILGEDEKVCEDDSEYEDEFLKEKCIDDLDKSDKNNENNKIKEIDKEQEQKNGNDINININNKESEIKNEDELNINSNEKEDKITSKYNNFKKNEVSNMPNQVNKINLKKPLTSPISPNPVDIESAYIIDAENIQEFKLYLLSQIQVFDEDYVFFSNSIPAKRFMQSPDPQTIFEFCANIMIITKMEKESIITALIYIERLIFNTGLLINSRNWRKIIFTALIISSKFWDDDSLENVHFSQIFTHLKLGEINLLEKNFLELINYKIYVKFSEYMKYYFAVKNMCLKYNFNGEKIVKINPEKIIRIQEYRYQLQKRMNKSLNLNNSASF